MLKGHQVQKGGVLHQQYDFRAIILEKEKKERKSEGDDNTKENFFNNKKFRMNNKKKWDDILKTNKDKIERVIKEHTDTNEIFKRSESSPPIPFLIGGHQVRIGQQKREQLREGDEEGTISNIRHWRD